MKIQFKEIMSQLEDLWMYNGFSLQYLFKDNSLLQKVKIRGPDIDWL